MSRHEEYVASAAAMETTGLLLGLPEEEAEEEGRQHRKTKSLVDSIPTGAPRRRNRHHRYRTSLGQFIQSMSGSLGDIAEDVQVEARIVRNTWREELQESESGKRFFLDMSLTRSMSVLPENLAEFVEEVKGQEPSEQEAVPLARYLALLGAVMAVSSNGASLAMLHGVDPPMKLYWRMTATALLLSSFAIRITYKEGFPKLSFGQCLELGGAVTCYVCHAICFNTAIEYTSIGNAVVGANSQALLLVIGKIFVGEPVVWMEGGGVLLAFCGCILCSTDEAAGPKDTKTALLGDFLAVGSAVFGVAYLTFAKAVRHTMPVTVFMFIVMFAGSFLTLFYMLVGGYEISVSNDAKDGIFGWITLEENHIFILAHIAVVCNVLGVMGFVRAMQFFDNIIIAVATLLEPLMATVIAYALGVGNLPGPFGWTGNVLVIIGTLGVVYPSIDKQSAH